MSRSRNRPASAAQRREQTRQQRQQRLQADQHKNQSSSRERRNRGKKTSNPWPLVGVVLLVVLVGVGIIAFIANQQRPTTESATPEVWERITSIDPQTRATVASGSADERVRTAMFNVQNKPPVLQGPTEKPQVFYLGGEYCPFCGGQRWAMVVALSQFGTFSQLEPVITSESAVPTYTFHKGTYTSQYIDFVPVELRDNANQPLEEMTPEQQQIVSTYDAPPYTPPQGAGGFPFISFGNQIVVTGGIVDLKLLIGKSYQEIAEQLENPTSETARSVLGAANYMTAAICSITNNQPENVCAAEPVPQMQIMLQSVAPTAYHVPEVPPMALSGPSEQMIRRRV